MAGATDFFFTMVLGFIFFVFLILAVGTAIKKFTDWKDGRKMQRLRLWLLSVFDGQFEELRRKMEQDGVDPLPHGLAFSHLRWELSVAEYFFSDLEEFNKNGGIPLLLSFSEGRPRLLLGVGEAGKEIQLNKYCVLLGAGEDINLGEEDIACLKFYYPIFAGEAFTARYAITGKEDPVERESGHE